MTKNLREGGDGIVYEQQQSKFMFTGNASGHSAITATLLESKLQAPCMVQGLGWLALVPLSLVLDMALGRWS